MRPDTPCNEASDEDVGSQSAAEKRLGPDFEGWAEDSPLQEEKLVRRNVSCNCA